jgi:hypothetical protein
VEFVLLPDNADTRLFIELSSHAADLTEAREALTLALSAPIPGLPDGVKRSLIANAVMAYCRTFFPSKVRTPITSFVQVPEELFATHDLVARFRNRTIAQSQSDLSVTYPIGILDAKTLNVLDVSAPTVCSTMPTEQVNRFITLIDEMRRRLDDVIEPIRDRLKAILTDADRAALVEKGPRPNAHLLQARAFANPATRSPYPRSHPLYLSGSPSP